MENNTFEKLNAVNVNGHTEQKNGLTYLSWAWAWAEVKKLYPDANYTIYENTLPNGYVVNYFTDGNTCWVKTGVTINGLEHIEELPVMDYRNKSIAYDMVQSTDINKAIQRSLTKACARHGLGLYIYAGEDLPEAEQTDTTPIQRNLKQEAKNLGINIDMLAEFLKKEVSELTEADYKYAIEEKRKQAKLVEGNSFKG